MGSVVKFVGGTIAMLLIIGLLVVFGILDLIF